MVKRKNRISCSEKNTNYFELQTSFFLSACQSQKKVPSMEEIKSTELVSDQCLKASALNQVSDLYNNAGSMDEKAFLDYLRQEQKDINVLNSRGYSALHTAAEVGHVNATRNVLNAGADVNLATSCGKTALTIASYNGHVGCCQLLIGFGARVNTREESVIPPLTAAITNSHVEVVITLLKSGACVNKTFGGFTALTHATFRDVGLGTHTRDSSSKGFYLMDADRIISTQMLERQTTILLPETTRLIEELLEHGGDPNIKDELGNHALIHAMSCNWKQKFSCLVNGEMPQAASRCVQDEAEKRCRLLVQHSANVNLVGENGMTALMHAASNSLHKCCRLLLAHKADINKVDNKGWTALMHALESNSTECCVVLSKGTALWKFFDGEDITSVSQYRSVNQSSSYYKQSWDLYKAALLKDNDELRARVKQQLQLNVNETDPVSAFALIFAIYNKQPRAVKQLIDAGVNIDAAMTSGKTAFQFAVEFGYTEGLQLLVNKGIETNSNRVTELLMSACMECRVDVVKSLLKAGAKVNEIDNYLGNTALMLAVSNSCGDNNRPSKAKNICGYSNRNHTTDRKRVKHPTFCILEESQGDRVKVTMQKIEKKKNEEEREIEVEIRQVTLLTRQRTEIVRLLLDAGADANTQDNKGRGALIHAIMGCILTESITKTFCKYGPAYEDVLSLRLAHDTIRFKSLISYNADVNVQDVYGQTPLMYAAQGNLMQHCELLISENAQINEMDCRKWTALTYAVVGNYVKCCQILIDHGADCNLQDRNGMTPLMHAITRNCQRLFDILLKASDLNICDTEGKTALMYAVNMNVKDEIRHKTVDNYCRSLIKYGADVNQRDYKGKTALMHSAERGLSVSTLVTGDSDVNIQDNNGRTAVMYACIHGHFRKWKNDVAPYCHIGIDPDVQDNEGMTTLMLIARLGDKDSGNICKCLQSDPNLKNANGMTALMLAIIFDSVTICEQIMKSPLGVFVDVQDNDGRTALMFAALHNSWKCYNWLFDNDVNKTIRDNDGRTALNYAVKSEYKCPLLACGLSQTKRDEQQLSALAPLLKDINTIINVGVEAGFNVSTALERLLAKNLKTACLMLENGADPFMPEHHQLLQEINETSLKYKTLNNRFEMFRFISTDEKQLMRLLVSNGILEGGATWRKSLAFRLFGKGQSDVVKYIFASGFITIVELKEMQQQHWPSLELSEFLQEALSNPWPLVKLAFTAVSSALGGGPERNRRVSQTQLPPRIQRMLMFQEPVTRLSVKHWDDIPLYFNPVEYERQPRPRPLLYYWPFGRELTEQYFEDENTDSEKEERENDDESTEFFLPTKTAITS